MGWGYCGEVNGRPVGYNIEATCDHPECKAEIDRGLAYCCGGMHGGNEIGCGDYFCPEHLFYVGAGAAVCEECAKQHPESSEES